MGMPRWRSHVVALHLALHVPQLQALLTLKYYVGNKTLQWE